MAILRQSPGEATLVAGTYALVDHYGEPMGFSAWFDVGDRLPLVATDEVVWFALTDRTVENAQAA
jgi:hypothetical protein